MQPISVEVRPIGVEVRAISVQVRLISVELQLISIDVQPISVQVLMLSALDLARLMLLVFSRETSTGNISNVQLSSIAGGVRSLSGPASEGWYEREQS